MRQHENVPLRVVLGAAGAAKNLMRCPRLEHGLLPGRAFHDARQNDGPRGKIDPGRKRFGARTNGQKFLLEQIFDDPAVLRQDPRVVNAHAADEYLLKFRSGPLRKVKPAQFAHQARPGFRRDEFLPPDLLSHSPALVTVEAENERRGHTFVLVSKAQKLDLLHERLISHPLKNERDLAHVALHDLQLVVVLVLEPVRELDGISNRRGKKQKPDVLREERERKFPDDPALRVVKIMEFIHHDRLNVTEIVEFLRVEQTIEEDLGHDDQNLRARVYFVIPGHQANIVLGKAPTDG